MKARDPLTNKWKFFVDKCLPFGSSISCSHFQRFSNALSHIMQRKLKIPRRITNYLDDFLFIARTLRRCNYLINKFLDLCKHLGIPVSMDKTEWGSEMIIFLGILLDGKHLVLAVPEDKRVRATNLLTELADEDKKKATVKQLQQLCGLLNFLGKAIFPGRSFTRRMYAKFSEIVNINGAPKSANDYKWKQHHHVKLDKEFKLDCTVWLRFLSSEICSVVCRPMVDLQKMDTSD